MAEETQTGALSQPRGVGCRGRWEGGSKGRGHRYTYIWFMLSFDRKQQNSVKQLSFNKKIKRKKFYRLIAPLPLSCFFLCLFFTKIQNKKHAAATAQSCPTLCDPMTIARQAPLSREFSRWGLERVAISFSRGSSPPRDRTCVSHIAGRSFILWATGEARDDEGNGLWSSGLLRLLRGVLSEPGH